MKTTLAQKTHSSRRTIDMDKGYIKNAIAKIVGEKEEKHITPSSATMGEIMGVVREDVLELMRKMYEGQEIAVSKTLNSFSFKCL